MASGKGGNNNAQEGNIVAPRTMTSDYGQRAAFALDRLVPGPNRDKAVARLFGVSVRTAKYLRAGQHWTIERLTQASRMISDFDAYLASPNLYARCDALERELAGVRDLLRGEADDR